MSKDLEQQFRKLFQNDYPGIEILREKLISPLWKDIGNPKINIDISENEKNKISQITIFANQGSEINFVDVELTDSVVLRNNRVTINKYIANHVVDIYQSALIFFHYKNTSREWRISYVYKGSGNSDTTNAKRYTYLCGSNLHCRTAAERFANLKKENGYPSSEKLIEAFSVEALTKEFFGQLFNWYEWACKVCKFPGENCIASNAELDDKNNRLNLIRLITRIMFVWFIKHKDLIPEWIFNKSELKNILSETDFDSETKGNYYNAVLQNLFFGALNKKIEERGFADKSEDGIPNQQYGIKTYYRDDNKKSFFKLSQEEVVKLFEGVPFLNGGLFECLDKVLPIEDKFKVQYIDGYSRNSERRAFVPNILFWNEEESNLGLVNILSRYNFTVEESSPNDVQVALDPELLGKIFENLLGVYNPETSESARKESGSFYTPREIVSYMVNRSIFSYLQEKIPDVSEENLEKLTNDDKSDDDEIVLTEEQIFAIRKALYEIKIIDPACGSGAFPMGILNKLVEIHVLLNRLSAKIKSEHNLYIKKGQFVNYTPNDDLKINAEYLGEKNFKLSVNGIVEEKIYNSQELTIHVKEIINKYNKQLSKNTIANLFSQGRVDDGISFNAIKTKQDIRQIVDSDSNDIVWQYKSYKVENKFRQYRNEEQKEETVSLEEDEEGLINYDSLYNLKTQIIQQSIFGVDIQPIAVQICKLRFFISLICEQPKTGSIENNYGYNPLPNLETKFVAANTLVGLTQEEQDLFSNTDEKVNKLKNDLINVRKNHFTSKTSLEKKKNREEDESLRKEIIEYLQKNSQEADIHKLNELKAKEEELKECIKNLPKNIQIITTEEQLALFGEKEIKEIKTDINKEQRDSKQNDLKQIQDKIKEQESKDKSALYSSINQLIEWNPYDQSAPASPYFDSDWMFGVKDGFDIVIANPPYIPTESISKEDKKKYEQIYKSAYGRINIYPIFYEKGINLLRTKGILCYITPYTILKNKYYIEARRVILSKTSIQNLVDLTGVNVFSEAIVDSIILTLIKKMDNNSHFSYIHNVSDFNFNSYKPIEVYQSQILNNNDLSFSNIGITFDFSRIYQDTIKLQNIVSFKQGIITGNNKKFIATEESKFTKKVITGADFNKYVLNWNGKYIEYIPEKLHRPRTIDIFETQEKLVLRQTGSYPICTIDTNSYYTLDTVHNGRIINNHFSIKYILALLNSKLFKFLYESSINETGKVFAQVKIMYVNPLPVKNITIEEQAKYIKLVDKILSLKKDNPIADTQKEEQAIDLLIYHLYGLSFEEAKVIDELLTEEEYNSEVFTIE